jgi:hypothetical protein
VLVILEHSFIFTSVIATCTVGSSSLIHTLAFPLCCGICFAVTFVATCRCASPPRRLTAAWATPASSSCST